MELIKLNLGCSDDLKPGYVNVDSHAPKGFESMALCITSGSWLTSRGLDAIVHKYRDDCVYTANLSDQWPLSGSTVDEIYAKDVFEHVDNASFPGNRGKIWVLNESYRVLKPGGLLEFLVPCVHMADMRMNPGAFADPTHVSFWTYDDRYYFTEEWNNPGGERGRLGPAYGIECRFAVDKWTLEEYGAVGERRSKVHAILRAVK